MTGNFRKKSGNKNKNDVAIRDPFPDPKMNEISENSLSIGELNLLSFPKYDCMMLEIFFRRLAGSLILSSSSTSR